MPVAMVQSPFEAGRLFAGEYAGKKARLCLANTTSGSPGINSTTSQWDAVELTGTGYARFQWTIPTGSYNSTTGRWEVPAQLASYTATAGGSGLTWNAAYLVIGATDVSTGLTVWNTGVSFVLTESPAVTLPAGQARGYSVQLFSAGFLVTA